MFNRYSKKILINLIPVMGIILYAHGSSGNSAINVQGTVVSNGYVSGANVYLDKNFNKTYDRDEPSALTDENGNYMITVQQEEINRYSVIAEITDTRSLNDNKYEHKFILESPAGKYKFISPLTTLVKNKNDNSPYLTLELAEASVKKALGISKELSLFDNYMKEKDTDTTSQNIEKISNVVAILFSRLINKAETELKIELTPDKLNAVMSAVSGLVLEQTSKIASDVLNDKDIYKIADNIMPEAGRKLTLNRIEESTQPFTYSNRIMDLATSYHSLEEYFDEHNAADQCFYTCDGKKFFFEPNENNSLQGKVKLIVSDKEIVTDGNYYPIQVNGIEYAVIDANMFNTIGGSAGKRILKLHDNKVYYEISTDEINSGNSDKLNRSSLKPRSDS
jgi:hypothetical protein